MPFLCQQCEGLHRALAQHRRRGAHQDVKVHYHFRGLRKHSVEQVQQCRFGLETDHVVRGTHEQVAVECGKQER